MRRIGLVLFLCLSLGGAASVHATTIYTNDPAALNAYNRDQTGIYVSGQGGVSFLMNADHDGAGAADFETEHDTGWNAGGSVGVDFGSIRSEFELNYRKNGVDTLKAAGLNDGSPGGDISVFSFLFNLFYDFENRTEFTPYIGAGVGGAVVSLENVTDSTGTVANVDAEETVFAFKGIIGGSLALTPRFDLTFDYSFFGTTDAELPNTATGGTIESEIRSHSVNSGLRFRF